MCTIKHYFIKCRWKKNQRKFIPDCIIIKVNVLLYQSPHSSSLDPVLLSCEKIKMLLVFTTLHSFMVSHKKNDSWNMNNVSKPAYSGRKANVTPESVCKPLSHSSIVCGYARPTWNSSLNYSDVSHGFQWD